MLDRRAYCDCGSAFTPVRARQLHCSKRCRDREAKRRSRSADMTAAPIPGPRSADISSSTAPARSLGDLQPYQWPEDHRHDHAGPTPGALQRDDYQLDYHDDGYPKLPACLDRRRGA